MIQLFGSGEIEKRCTTDGCKVFAGCVGVLITLATDFFDSDAARVLWVIADVALDGVVCFANGVERHKHDLLADFEHF